MNLKSVRPNVISGGQLSKCGDLLEIEIYYNKKGKIQGLSINGFQNLSINGFQNLSINGFQNLFKLSFSFSFFSSKKKSSREIFLEQKRALARFHFRKALAGASRGGAPIILDPRKGISFLFKERISISL